MKFGNDISSRIGRCLFGLIMLLFCLGLIDLALDDGAGFSGYDISSLILAGCILAILFYSKYETAMGELTEEGVDPRKISVYRCQQTDERRGEYGQEG